MPSDQHLPRHLHSWSSWRPLHARARYGRWNRWPGSRQARRAVRSRSAQLPPAPPRTAPPLLRCVSGTRRRTGRPMAGFLNGGIRWNGLDAQSSSCPITRRLRRRSRWWGSMTSCGWHGWPARSSRTNLSRPARLPFVADQVSSAVTLAAMARQVFSLLPAHHPSVGAHRRPERVGSAFSLHLVQSPNGTEAPSVGSSPP